MKFSQKCLLLSFAVASTVHPYAMHAQESSPASAADVQFGNQPISSTARQLFLLGNQARIEQGARPLTWDPTLAAAAQVHCARLASEVMLSHQYNGEANLSQRVSQAGAHFSLVEENIAEGDQPATIHQAWMNSRYHRENLLNPGVDRVGIAVIARGDMLYAVADFAHAVSVLTPEQVEATISNLVQAAGVSVHGNSSGARIACAQDHGLPASLDNRRPEFIMRWQDAELLHLPSALVDRIASGKYHEAAVGSCPSESAENTFTVYRIAVLLLKPESTTAHTDFVSR
jgi:uncharacterized protein YkwD